jgi:hypothetical protein
MLEVNKNVFVVVPEKDGILNDIPFVHLKIPLNDRVLHSNFLESTAEAPSSFICASNGETVYEWKALQVYLLSKGFSSFVLTYSGFGNSAQLLRI